MSNLEWPHKPHKPARLWSHVYGVLGIRSIYAYCGVDDLREVPPRFVPWTFLPHHWSLAVLRMTSTSPESLGMRLSVASLAVGSGHARLSAYPCELYFTSNCGSRCCCQVHACFRLQSGLSKYKCQTGLVRRPPWKRMHEGGHYSLEGTLFTGE